MIDLVPVDDCSRRAAPILFSRHLRPPSWTKKFEFNTNDVADAIRLVAGENKFHPIRKYLMSLEWDGINRLPNIHHDVLRLESGSDQQEALTSVLLIKWFVSCVARAMVPGCKVDTVLILVGKQGVLKWVRLFCDGLIS